jgi:beta-phosphoglucomutase
MSDDKILSIANKKNDLFVHLIKYGLTPKDVMNGIKQLIDDAITRGLQLIAISSSANAVLEMKCLGLFDKFTYVSSYSTKRTSNFDKGQQSPLLQSLKKLNINPSECIGLEDDVEGIIEYKSANVFAVAIANYHESIKTEADY